jgi:OOP family OmpA-OmpF porin
MPNLPAQQNLVYNGDFELYDSCPSGISVPGNPQIAHCIGWTTPTLATSDYFNYCNPVLDQSNPLGYQEAQNGQAYCGLLAFSWLAFPSLPWWEYVQGQLSSPLTQGHRYKISFYASNAFGNAAVNGLGCYVSQNPISRSDVLPIDFVEPQVSANYFISDSLAWTKIEGEFIANGDERYITIGWFEDTMAFQNMYWDVNFPGAYYYVDNVQVYELPSEINVPNVFTPNGDDVNDNWHVRTVNLTAIEIYVFDRWGMKVFESHESNTEWDGNNGSSPCTEGVYYYIITASGSDRKSFVEKGFVHLVR